uniref:Uncharacterized protein n=1 Tax=Anguilla anguilla TaxID=7936 RepID=A0A0E9WCG5_ANGAN
MKHMERATNCANMCIDFSPTVEITWAKCTIC